MWRGLRNLGYSSWSRPPKLHLHWCTLRFSLTWKRKAWKFSWIAKNASTDAQSSQPAPGTSIPESSPLVTHCPCPHSCHCTAGWATGRMPAPCSPVPSMIQLPLGLWPCTPSSWGQGTFLTALFPRSSSHLVWPLPRESPHRGCAEVQQRRGWEASPGLRPQRDMCARWHVWSGELSLAFWERKFGGDICASRPSCLLGCHEAVIVCAIKQTWTSSFLFDEEGTPEKS